MIPRLLTASSVTATLLAMSALARADDVVHLKNGGFIRGIVMEEQPDKGVTIRLADGTVRSVPANDLGSVDHEQARPPAPGRVSAPPPGGAQEEPPSHTPTAYVTLQSGNPAVTLDEIRTEGAYGGAYATASGYGSVTLVGSSWRTKCTVPCDERLSLNARYRIGGEGVQPSSAFVLPKTQTPLVLHVDAGSQAAYGWGQVLTWVGVAGVAVGASFLVAGAVVGSGALHDCSTLNLSYHGAEVAFPVGGLLLIPGIILWATNGTHVTTQDRRSLARAGQHLAPQGLTF
jgi:hypothetical protein